MQHNCDEIAIIRPREKLSQVSRTELMCLMPHNGGWNSSIELDSANSNSAVTITLHCNTKWVINYDFKSKHCISDAEGSIHWPNWEGGEINVQINISNILLHSRTADLRQKLSVIRLDTALVVIALGFLIQLRTSEQWVTSVA